MSQTSSYRALIIDDEPDIRELMSITLSRLGIQCTEAENINGAIKALALQDFHFCLTDMKLPDGNGMDFIALARKKHPRMPIAMITAFGNMEVAIEALKAGAFDFIAKPLDIKKLRSTVNLAIKLTDVPINTLINEHQFSALVGESNATKELKQQLIKIARSQAPAFIHGINGCRKDEIAQIIHNNSARREASLSQLNCESFSEDEFVHQVLQGKDPQQTLIRAHEGTLLIRNVSQLSAISQAKLFDFLQQPHLLIDGQQQECSFRLLCADTDDLSIAVDNNEFRQDLHHLISVINLAVPTLKERQQDLAAIAQFFVNKYAQDWQMPALSLTKSAVKALADHTYQTDILELENCLKRAFTSCEGESIDGSDILWPKSQASSLQETETDELSIRPNGDLEGYLENIERQAIVQALEANRWNKTVTAEHLGISFRTLRYRCKKLHID